MTAPSITVTALLGDIPVLASIVLMVVFGVETRTRTLESITADELAALAD